MTEDFRTVQAITNKGEVTVRLQDLERYAARRQRLHKDHATQRVLSDNNEYIGMVGEWQFAYEFDFPMDLTTRIGGDKNVDFMTPSGSLDVKSARLAHNLLVEVDKPHARYLVLSQYIPNPLGAELLGWEYGTQMVRRPTRTFGGHDIVNHWTPAKELRRMEVLAWIFANAKGLANA